jgi:lysylphosphatidylglycerol synthetase-like protein (DUF2156 family)
MNMNIQTSIAENKPYTKLSVVAGNKLTEAQRQELVRLYGYQSSAYFNLQEGVEHFGFEGLGFISYYPQKTLFGRVNIVFTNPVCHPDHMKRLLSSFFAMVPGKTIFLGVDRTMSDYLKEFNFNANQMGTEFSMPIQSYEIKGKSMKHLRHSANLGKRCGLTVKELPWSEVNAQAVKAISESWRGNKAVKGRELKLLTRPPEFRDGWGVRKFYCFQGEKLLGYVFFDPYFKDGKVAGYCANILRKDPDARPSDLLDFTILEAMKVFKAEGIEELSLGISPMFQVEKEEGDRFSLRHLQKLMYKYANSLYAFQALAYHKTRYRGNESKWYLCTDDVAFSKVVLAILFGTNLMGFKKQEEETYQDTPLMDGDLVESN